MWSEVQVVTQQRRFTEEVTLNGALPLAAWASPTRPCFVVHDERSVMFSRPRSARLRSLHSGSLRITSLFLAVD
jgi:hypothetical protein